MASRDLRHLHPDLEPLARKFVAEAKTQGIDALIYTTYRSSEEQDALYRKGRSESGRIVTYCKGGQSKHNATLDGKPASRAFDCVPVVKGKALWNDNLAYLKLAKIGKDLGLKWGGEWKGLKDSPHFELPD